MSLDMTVERRGSSSATPQQVLASKSPGSTPEISTV